MDLFAGSPPVGVAVNSGTVSNYGPATVYYRAAGNVTATLNDGSLLSGQSVSLDGVQFFIAASDRTTLHVAPPTAGSTSSSVGSAAIPIMVSRETAAVGPSASFLAPGTGHFSQESLSVTDAPAGSPLTMSLRKNGVSVTSLSIPAGSIDPVQQTVSTQFVAGDVIDVDCSSAGSGTPAGGVGYVAWMIIDSLTAPVTAVDTDGGPYMDLVQQQSSRVSYWGLADSIGRGALDHESLHNGTYNGTVSKGQAPLVLNGDASVSFNGTTGYVSIPGSSALHLAEFTLEAWIKPTTLPVGAMIMDIGGGGYVSFYFSDPGLTTTTKLIGTIWNGAANYQATGTGTIVAGTKYHVALTWNNTTKDFKTFINGVQDSTINHPGVSIVYSVPTTSAIGAAASGASNFFNGIIDEPAIYNTALPAATLLSHYNQGITGSP